MFQVTCQFLTNQTALFLKVGHPRPLFRLFSVFFKQTFQILQQINVKNNVHPVPSGARIQTQYLLIMSLLL